MQEGTVYRKEDVVHDKNTASFLGSGDVEVFATPAMVALMEDSAKECVKPGLSDEQTTVGTAISVTHSAATPVGMKVWCDARLTRVDGKKLVFELKAYDEAGPIGEGTHERVIVDREKFKGRAYGKLK